MSQGRHPPKYSKEQRKTLFEEIAGFINKNRKCPVWIGGNLNLPDTNWETRSAISHQYSKDINDKCLEVTHDCYLEQLALFPRSGLQDLVKAKLKKKEVIYKEKGNQFNIRLE